MAAVAVSLAVLLRLSANLFTSASLSAAVSASSVVVSARLLVVAAVVAAVVVVAHLSLKIGDCCHERLHLFEHAFLLCRVRHFLSDLLLHTLLCAQAFDDLVDNGGGLGLAVEAQGIGGYDWLTALDIALAALL